jgi:hypothetical protein
MEQIAQDGERFPGMADSVTMAQSGSSKKARSRFALHELDQTQRHAFLDAIAGSIVFTE